MGSSRGQRWRRSRAPQLRRLVPRRAATTQIGSKIAGHTAILAMPETTMCKTDILRKGENPKFEEGRRRSAARRALRLTAAISGGGGFASYARLTVRHGLSVRTRP